MSDEREERREKKEEWERRERREKGEDKYSQLKRDKYRMTSLLIEVRSSPCFEEEEVWCPAGPDDT